METAHDGPSPPRAPLALLLLAGAALVLFTACLAHPNPLQGTPIHGYRPAGFLIGLWHGIIAPITFLLSLFADGFSIYEVHNSGGWYNFGFLLGLSTWGGGAGAGWRRR